MMDNVGGFAGAAWRGWGLGVVLFLACWSAPVADAEERLATFEVVVSDGLLTLRAHDAPLAEVLRAISDAASLRLVLRGELDTPGRVARLVEIG